MNLHLRKFLIFVGLLLAIFICSSVYSSLNTTLAEQTKKMIAASGLSNATTDGLGFSFPGTVNIKKFAFVFPVQRYQVPVTLTDSQVDLVWSELLFLKKAFEGKTQLFSGTMSFNVKQNFNGDFAAIDTEFNNIDVSQIVPLSTFGVSGKSKGRISMELAQQPGNIMVPKNGTFDVSLDGVNFVGGMIPGVPVPLPRLSDTSLKLVGKVENGVPKFRSEAQSNLGKFQGEFANNTISGELSLTDEGEKSFGTLLVLAAGGKEINDKKHWRISTSRDLKSVSVRPVNP